MNLIDPNTINDGDPVVIQDADKNVVRGPTSFDHEGYMTAHAFGIEIRFARWTNSARGGLGGYSPIKGIKIVGHEPPMELLSIDVVPKQRFKGSNPT